MKTAFAYRLLLIASSLLALAASTGCTGTLQKLPPIDAAAFDYKRNDPLGGTMIHAENVKVNDPAGTVTADVVQWDTTYPTWGIHVKATGYRQNEPATKP